MIGRRSAAVFVWSGGPLGITFVSPLFSGFGMCDVRAIIFIRCVKLFADSGSASILCLVMQSPPTALQFLVIFSAVIISLFVGCGSLVMFVCFFPIVEVATALSGVPFAYSVSLS